MLRHWSQFVPNMSTDIRGHEALHHYHRRSTASVNRSKPGRVVLAALAPSDNGPQREISTASQRHSVLHVCSTWGGTQNVATQAGSFTMQCILNSIVRVRQWVCTNVLEYARVQVFFSPRVSRYRSGENNYMPVSIYSCMLVCLCDNKNVYTPFLLLLLFVLFCFLVCCCFDVTCPHMFSWLS